MSKLNVETIENLSATASVNVSDIAQKTTLLASTGASSVGFTPSGSVAATNVQAAIEELSAEIGGAHTHAISNVTGLQTALDGKQATLVSGTNIKTVNGSSILGSGNLTVSSNSALVLLATLSPTAAANIDFLTLFSGTYDDYLIIGNGIKFAADDGVRLQFANAGVIDVSSGFWQTTANVGPGGTALAVATVTTGTLRTAGSGANFEIFARNVNNAATLKSAHITSTWQSTAGGTTEYTSLEYMTVYAGGSVSGFRLTSSFGANFAAQGSIKVYGIAKA